MSTDKYLIAPPAYKIIINEAQRKLIQRVLAAHFNANSDSALDAEDREELLMLAGMFRAYDPDDPHGTGLVPGTDNCNGLCV